jgi:hypothetical protein
VGTLETLDAEKLGAGSGAESVQAVPESALELVGSHGREATPSNRHVRSRGVTGVTLPCASVVLTPVY